VQPAFTDPVHGKAGSPVPEDSPPTEERILARAWQHACEYLGSLADRPVATTASVEALRARFGRDLPEHPTDPLQTIDELVRDAEGGLLGSASGRFFGWVIGGSLPVAIAADWLAATWDQNAAAYALSPAASVVEETCGAWLKDVFGLPAAASFALVTGCQMAHTTALAAARHKLLRDRGIDVECHGLAGAPPIRVLVGEHHHESILRAVRLLGIGTGQVERLACGADAAIDLGALRQALDGRGGTILCLQAGELNTGAYDDFAGACALAHEAGAWVHVDGAFGLWAAASPRLRHLLAGIAQADSWATDGHKWLNLPYDSGFAFVAHPDAHAAAFAQQTPYGLAVDGTRRQIDWSPEWSRRARGFAAYAALRTLGRSGLAALVESCCDMTARLVEGLAWSEGVEVLAPPRINQALVRFLARDGDHDRRTDAVIEAVRVSGTAWFGGVTWRGQRAMRISVCNWRTGPRDVDRALAAIRETMWCTP
jgi:glutamate/tyrosine decarboxylase-like PLP-dependent enzyme